MGVQKEKGTRLKAFRKGIRSEDVSLFYKPMSHPSFSLLRNAFSDFAVATRLFLDPDNFQLLEKPDAETSSCCICSTIVDGSGDCNPDLTYDKICQRTVV